MRFTFNGRNYSLTVERKYQNVELFTDRKKHILRSTYPYTILSLHEQGANGASVLVKKVSVGCLPSDPYSNRAGLLFAMKKLTSQLKFSDRAGLTYPKEFFSAMWQAYVNRGKQPKRVVETSTVVEENPTRLLPAPRLIPEEVKDIPTVH